MFVCGRNWHNYPSIKNTEKSDLEQKWRQSKKLMRHTTTVEELQKCDVSERAKHSSPIKTSHLAKTSRSGK